MDNMASNPSDNGDNESDTDPAFIGDDAVEVIDIGPQNEDDMTADDFDEMDMGDADGDEGMSEEAATFVRERDDATVVFSKHKDPVLCVAIDPRTSSLAVTGGQDDVAYVWRLSTGEVHFECTGHKDSVNCVGFSFDSSLVATGDMSGVVKVWNVETGKEVWSYELSEIEWLRWHKTAPVLLVGTTDGNTWLFNIPTEKFKTFPGTGTKCSVGEFMPDGLRACVGYEDGTVKVWDLRSCVALHTYTTPTHGHEGTVTCLSCHPDNKLVLSGSTDATSLLLNTDNGKRLARFDCKTSSPSTDAESESGEETDSVEALGFSSSSNYFATGTLSGMLTIWDAKTQKPRHRFLHNQGIVKLEWDPVEPIVYTASLDGCVYAWHAREDSEGKQYQGHTANILDMALSSNGTSIVTASDDNTARVFNIRPAAVAST